jgi:3D (Asp-Asp-Asp) domain-containing protein
MQLLAFLAALALSAWQNATPLSAPIRHAAGMRPTTHGVRWRTTTVVTTAYVVAPDVGCDVYLHRTANNTAARRGVVAVDTGVFPFGTRFRIAGYGEGVAEDRGGAIVGRRVDLAVKSCREAFAWGRRTMVVAYLPPRR